MPRFSKQLRSFLWLSAFILSACRGTEPDFPPFPTLNIRSVENGGLAVAQPAKGEWPTDIAMSPAQAVLVTQCQGGPVEVQTFTDLPDETTFDCKSGTLMIASPADTQWSIVWGNGLDSNKSWSQSQLGPEGASMTSIYIFDDPDWNGKIELKVHSLFSQ